MATQLEIQYLIDRPEHLGRILDRHTAQQQRIIELATQLRNTTVDKGWEQAEIDRLLARVKELETEVERLQERKRVRALLKVE